MKENPLGGRHKPSACAFLRPAYTLSLQEGFMELACVFFSISADGTGSFNYLPKGVRKWNQEITRI